MTATWCNMLYIFVFLLVSDYWLLTPQTKLVINSQRGLSMGREIRRFSVIVMILLISTAALASVGKESLKGLKGVMVDVEEIESNMEKDGLKRSSIQTDVKKKLRKAGIKVLSKKENRKLPVCPGCMSVSAAGKFLPDYMLIPCALN